MVDLQLRELGYLGVTETLCLLDLQGARIAEFPTTLHVRILGRSKMKVVRTIFGHLGNLLRMRYMRRLIDRNAPLGLQAATPAANIDQQGTTVETKINSRDTQ
ncbi:MAG: hypothetical protein DMG73_12940 [Acidobacteria bacterium]|nr:MAG: hypothetical protein DMG73_12940 [Acidobacteriota bacterium]